MTQLLRPPEVFWTEKREIEGEVVQEERGGVRVEMSSERDSEERVKVSEHIVTETQAGQTAERASYSQTPRSESQGWSDVCQNS